jgi:hypothetical protein
VYVDGAIVGAATLNIARPDVVAAYPAIAPANPGWQYFLDTTSLANGVHTITIRIVDSANNDISLVPVAVTVSN